VAARVVFAGFGAGGEMETRGGARVYAVRRGEIVIWGGKFHHHLKHLSSMRTRRATSSPRRSPQNSKAHEALKLHHQNQVGSQH
jgi:hypothetical protein